MTSLIDVIFLLLLFFMLTSTFSKFSEVEISAAVPGADLASGTPPFFLQLGPETITLNGDLLTFDALGTSALGRAKEGSPLIVSLRGAVDSQRLIDLLVALRGLPALSITILGS